MEHEGQRCWRYAGITIQWIWRSDFIKRIYFDLYIRKKHISMLNLGNKNGYTKYVMMEEFKSISAGYTMSISAKMHKIYFWFPAKRASRVQIEHAACPLDPDSTAGCYFIFARFWN